MLEASNGGGFDAWTGGAMLGVLGYGVGTPGSWRSGEGGGRFRVSGKC